uniref:non-specific serine/threonine protein kinase n=1 Tax=Mesocestoides corti TaxID=53468 RepID=A0A5K3EWB3_MESCO
MFTSSWNSPPMVNCLSTSCPTVECAKKTLESSFGKLSPPCSTAIKKTLSIETSRQRISSWTRTITLNWPTSVSPTPFGRTRSWTHFAAHRPTPRPSCSWARSTPDPRSMSGPWVSFSTPSSPDTYPSMRRIFAISVSGFSVANTESPSTCPQISVMEDKWTNINMEDDILRPYQEPPPDYNDPVRLAKMTEMGFTLEEIKDSLENNKFNNVTATYLLLGTDRKNSSSTPPPPSSSAAAANNQPAVVDESPKQKTSTQKESGATALAAVEDSMVEAPDTPQVLVSSTSMRKGSSTTRANGSATSTAPVTENPQSTPESTSSASGKQKPTWSAKRGETASVDSTTGSAKVDKPKTAIPTTHFDTPRPTETGKDSSSNRSPVKSGGVRRTRTFTSSDKRRNTVVVSGTGGRIGVSGANGDADTSKALVRVPNMDNIVDQVGDESYAERDASDKELAVDGLGIHSSSSGRCVGVGSSDPRLAKALTQAATLTGPVSADAPTSSEKEGSESTALRRHDSSMSRRPQRNKVSRPAIRFEAADEIISADHPSHSTSNAEGSPPTNVVPAFMRGAPDRSTAPAARLTHRVEYSQRYRPPEVAKPRPSEEETEAEVEPEVVPETPIKETTKPTEYHSSGSSAFIRSVSSRLSKSNRMPAAQSVEGGKGDKESGGGGGGHLVASDSPIPAHRAFSSEGKPHESADAAAATTTSATDDPWSPMLPAKVNPEGDTKVAVSNSLEPLLPACYDKKPRNITFFSSAWRKASSSGGSTTSLLGSNPDRLMSQLIGALSAAHIHFARLGKYRLQFVYSPPAPNSSTKSPLNFADKVTNRVRVAVEICHVMATSSYVTRFKNLASPNSHASTTEDFKSVTQSLVRIAKASCASTTPSSS